MPIFTLIFNAFSLVFLLFGYWAIRNKKVTLHKFCMFLALFMSIVLVTLFVEHRYSHGFAIVKSDMREHFGLWLKPFFIFLILHILAAMSSAILSVPSVYWGVTQQLAKHRKLAKVTLAIWIFSSISGMALFFMMAQL